MTNHSLLTLKNVDPGLRTRLILIGILLSSNKEFELVQGLDGLPVPFTTNDPRCDLLKDTMILLSFCPTIIYTIPGSTVVLF